MTNGMMSCHFNQIISKLSINVISIYTFYSRQWLFQLPYRATLSI